MTKLNTLLQHPRDQITEVIRRIYTAGLTTTSGGNISILDDDGDIWVTPAAIDKGSLQRKDIVCVKKAGTVKGHHKPSSEFPFPHGVAAEGHAIRSPARQACADLAFTSRLLTVAEGCAPFRIQSSARSTSSLTVLISGQVSLFL